MLGLKLVGLALVLEHQSWLLEIQTHPANTNEKDGGQWIETCGKEWKRLELQKGLIVAPFLATFSLSKENQKNKKECEK